MDGINIEEKLKKERKLQEEVDVIDQFNEVVEREKSLEEKIIDNIYGDQDKDECTPVDLSLLDADRVFNLEQIKKICIRYRLRFLSTKYFKGDIPQEAVIKMKNEQKRLGVTFDNLKIIAPSRVFKLEDCDSDPLLFAKVAPDTYYLIHKWGNDLAWYRSFLAWPMKNFNNLGISLLVLSAIITMIMPRDLLVNHPTISVWPYRGMFFMYTLITLTGLTALYTFMLYKNFTVNEWNKKYFN